jgi:hypothetical protein
MPEIISCPDCSRKLRVPDDLIGKKVRCPGCNVMFMASAVEEAPPPPPRRSSRSSPREDAIEEKPRSSRHRAVRTTPDDEPPRARRRHEEEEERRGRRRYEDEDEDEDRREDEEDDYDDRYSSRARRDGWKKVRMGINLIIISVWVMLGTIGFSFCGGAIVGFTGAMSAAGSNNPNAAMGAVATTGIGFILLMVVAGLLTLVSKGLQIAGHGFCIMVPPKRDSAIKVLALTTFALAIAQIAFNLLGNLISALTTPAGFAGAFGSSNPLGTFTAGTGISVAMGLLSLVCSIAWFVVFCLFLRSIALTVRNRGLADTIRTFMISVGAFLGAAIVLGAIMFAIIGAALVSTLGGAGGPPSRSTANAFGGAMLVNCFFALALGGGALALFVWYVVILHQVRGSLDRFIRRI